MQKVCNLKNTQQREPIEEKKKKKIGKSKKHKATKERTHTLFGHPKDKFQGFVCVCVCVFGS